MYACKIRRKGENWMLSDKSDQNDNVRQVYFSMTFSHYYDDIYCKKEYDLYSGSDNEYEINQFRNNSPSILEILKDKI